MFFFFNDTATTEIYTLSLHDALPISANSGPARPAPAPSARPVPSPAQVEPTVRRSEEHTSELQSRLHLVCRLLLEKKKHDPEHLARASLYAPLPQRHLPATTSVLVHA